ncbi:MAG TPA: hypothetical protein DEF12_15765 [Rhodobacteraceae bacterium]|jgi:LuxR family transcriptional regulator|nr:hypothetical protein [Paracoccaceae bacterium]HBV56476.1 hypothetical protein [Paracoccaceae bacterium]
MIVDPKLRRHPQRIPGCPKFGSFVVSSLSDDGGIWHENGRVIKILNDIMHLKVQRLPQLNPNTPLTLRQREVLQWVGDGKTMLDIATIMDLTPATVAKHLKMARDALNVETTAQAVLKLSMLNQMFIMDL